MSSIDVSGIHVLVQVGTSCSCLDQSWQGGGEHRATGGCRRDMWHCSGGYGRAAVALLVDLCSASEMESCWSCQRLPASQSAGCAGRRAAEPGGATKCWGQQDAGAVLGGDDLLEAGQVLGRWGESDRAASQRWRHDATARGGSSEGSCRAWDLWRWFVQSVGSPARSSCRSRDLRWDCVIAPALNAGSAAMIVGSRGR
jgi:hypothetical protein